MLDNAHSAAQVRPLLPGNPTCGVLVTARRSLIDLEGAGHLTLTVLSEGEAVTLLGRLAGEERLAAEPAAARDIARSCGNLPLALRIAAAKLQGRPDWPIQVLADRLGTAKSRLDELELADLGVRASVGVSHQELRAGGTPTDRAAAEAFGLLGVPDWPDISVPVAARLLDRPVDVTERVLERLVDAQLLQSPTPGRYRMHDLLRLYAREHARRDHPARRRTAALSRALGVYVAAAWETLALLRPGDRRLGLAGSRWAGRGPGFAAASEALAWMDAEHGNLVAAAEQAAGTPALRPMVPQLAQALFGFFMVRSHWRDWEKVNRTALDVACRLGDLASSAQAHNDLGIAMWRQGGFSDGVHHLEQALALFRRLGDRHGQAASLNNLGNLQQFQGRFDEARSCLAESLTIYRELGNRRGQASSLNNLGMLAQRLQRYDDAVPCLRESVLAYEELGDRSSHALSLVNLGLVLARLGRYDEALACQEQSLAIDRELGDRAGEAGGLGALGAVYARLGRYDRALACQQESLAICRELGNRHGQAESLRELGVIWRALGGSDQARSSWRQALAIFDQLQTVEAEEVRALLAEPRRQPPLTGPATAPPTAGGAAEQRC